MVPNGFKDWAKPVGTGAFTLEKLDPGVRIVFKKRPDYWKQGRGCLDGVDVTVINDGSARLNALISGQSGRDQPRRPQGGRDALQDAENRDRAGARRLVHDAGDAGRQGAVLPTPTSAWRSNMPPIASRC